MILLVIFIIIISYLYFKRTRIEEFENPHKQMDIINFSKKQSNKESGIFLSNNEGQMSNSENLLSNKSTVTIAYSLYEKDESGTLLYVPNNYCQISIESKDEKIQIFISYLNKIYHYNIDRYIYRNNQHKLILSLLLNESKQELYVNNKKLYFYDSILKNNSSTKYAITSEPIIINKNKRLKGVLHGIITHNRVIKAKEVQELYNHIKNNFITRNVNKVEIHKDISPPVKNNTRCNFKNKDICDTCPNTQIDLKNSKIIYETKQCEDRIIGYCEANKDYMCDVINITNKLGKY